jgi:hypothetical protein
MEWVAAQHWLGLSYRLRTVHRQKGHYDRRFTGLDTCGCGPCPAVMYNAGHLFEQPIMRTVTKHKDIFICFTAAEASPVERSKQAYVWWLEAIVLLFYCTQM